MSADDPLFVIATTRAGSTLLKLMLDHHPELCVPGEFEFALAVEPHGASLEPCHTYLETNRHFVGHGLVIDRSLSYPELLRSFPDMQTATALVDYYADCLDHGDRRGLEVADASLRTIAGRDRPAALDFWRAWLHSYQGRVDNDERKR